MRVSQPASRNPTGRFIGSRLPFDLIFFVVDIFPNVGVMAVFHGAEGVTPEQEY
jgi:hypothetical protein